MRYEVHGRSDAAARTVLLSSGLGGAGAFWQPQLAALSERYRVIVYDQRGTGANREPLPDGYTIGAMADDVVAILDALDVAHCAFVGHALGGIVGLELALRAKDRVDRLVLVNAWAKTDVHTKTCFAIRKNLLLHVGPEAYVQAQPIFLYPAPWLSAHAERMKREEAHGVAHFQGTDTLLKRIGALEAFDVSDRLAEIAVPTLVAAARDDVLVPWTASQRLAEGMPRARLWLTPEGGHGYTVTEPDLFNAGLLAFLTETTHA